MNKKTVRALLPFLVLLAALTYNLEADIENSFPNGAMTRNAVNADLPTARTNLDIYSKGEVDAIVATPAADLAAHVASTGTAVHGLGTAALKNTGTSGDAVPLLSAANTWSGNVTVGDGGLDSNSYLFRMISDYSGVKQYSTVEAVFGANPYLHVSVASATDGSARAMMDIYANKIAFLGDNEIDIGENGYGRPRSLYVGTSISEAGALLSDKYLGVAHNNTSTAHNATALASEAYVTGYAAKKAGDAAQDFSAKILTLGGNLKTGSNWISGDGDNEGIYIDGSGNVGIGTGTPQSKFHLSNGSLEIDDNFNLQLGRFGGLAYITSITPGVSRLAFAYRGSEVMNFDTGGEVLIATTTDAGDYKLQVNGNAYVSGTGYFVGALTAASYADNSDSPETLADAYEIINSHETKNGRLDHSKLSSKAWGKKSVQVGLKKAMKQVGTQTKEIDEPIYEDQPDQASRNISMVISAQALAIRDLLKRIEALEKK